MAFPFKDKAFLKNANSVDIYGQKIPGAGTVISCSIISLLETPSLTSTGQDVSASRGRAGDEETVSKIIVPLTTKVSKGDVVVVSPADETGIHLQVVTALVKTSVKGKPAFIELRLVQTAQ